MHLVNKLFAVQTVSPMWTCESDEGGLMWCTYGTYVRDAESAESSVKPFDRCNITGEERFATVFGQVDAASSKQTVESVPADNGG